MSSGAVANNAVVQEALARAQQLAAANAPQSDRYSAGQKRPRSDDDTHHIPSKRAADGYDAQGMNTMNPGEALIVETIEIPDSVVGLVIGRGGEQISAIQAQSGCRVQMAGEPTPTNTRLCTLNGARVNIDRARTLISEVISRSNMRQAGTGANAGALGGRDSNGLPVGSIQETVLVPGSKCGLIIGRNGETIKSLQESLQVKMLLIQDSQAVSSAPKPLRITGSIDKVENAKRTIESIINSEDGRPAIAKSVGEVIVPRSSVGIIIGKGGETIKRLAQDSGCKIQFKPDDDPNTPDRCATLQGTPDQIARATQMISDLLQRNQHNPAQETFLMHVPANKTGLVIGKGGDTIKQICHESGAHVELSRDPPPNASEKVFVLKGTPYQIHHAQHIIRIKVGDIPPGTPVPHFSGSAGGAVATPVAYGMGYDPYNQWSQATAAGSYGGQGDASQWNAYYQQQGGAVAANSGGYSATQAASVAATGSTSSAAATTNAAGQPDYSAQWAEYYRIIGLHDKAALIEQQAKAGGAANGGAIASQQQTNATTGSNVYNSGSYN